MTSRTMPFLAAGLALAVAGNAGAQSAGACGTQPHCVEVTTFVATVTDFRESTTGYNQVLSVTVRFRNTTTRPLVLGYVAGSALATDDEGNRYTPVAGSLRGLGEITTSRFDPKFVLQPGESSDGRIELSWRRGNQIMGTRYVVELAVREIDPVQGNQWRLGREHALQFRGFGPAAETTPAAPAPVAAPSTPAEPLPDPCEGKTRCYAAGPFVAELTRLNESRQNHNNYFYHILTFTVRFRNLSDQPVVLAYADGSAVVVDDQGNRYGPMPSGQAVSGIGISRRNTADPSFALRPGEARDATFQMRFQARPRAVLGTSYTFDFAVEQLEMLPRNQMRTMREFTLGFRDVRVGGQTVGDAARGLLDAIRGRP
jgi:hypothetical protein